MSMVIIPTGMRMSVPLFLADASGFECATVESICKPSTAKPHSQRRLRLTYPW